jgi:hypothetical protein
MLAIEHASRAPRNPWLGASDPNLEPPIPGVEEILADFRVLGRLSLTWEARFGSAIEHGILVRG